MRQVCDEICLVLEPDREADRPRRDAGLAQLVSGEVKMGHGCRVVHHAAGIPDIRHEPDDAQSVDDLLDAAVIGIHVAGAGEIEREHR